MTMNRFDGYMNAVIGHGLRHRDPFASYGFGPGNIISDIDAANLYTYNGIAQKIIDAPANEAVKQGFSLRENETELAQTKQVMSVLEDLRADERFSRALSWNRLYGGAAVLMIADDGAAELSEPLNENRLNYIERLDVFEPPDITTQDIFLYDDPRDPRYGRPQYYQLTGYYGGTFLVHESRLLLFRGDPLPRDQRRMRNDWGGKVFERIAAELQNYNNGLSLGLMALSRLSQGVLKLNGLAGKLSNDFGETQVRKRLQLIDMARHMMNTVALDSDDDYDQKNTPLAGVQEVIQEFQVALSAVTDIPVTILFGRSPAGQNATGEADFQNFYNMVRRIQTRTLKPQLSRLVDLIGKCKNYKISLPSEYTLEFAPLRTPTEKEIAETRNLAGQAEKNRADAWDTLIKSGTVYPEEIRDKIEAEGLYPIDRTLDDDRQQGGGNEP